MLAAAFDACSTGSSAPSDASATSCPTRRTSCARRSSVLRAQVELLDRETDERSRHEATVTLLRRLDELDRLVGDMLTLASAEAGQLIEPRPIDLGDFFEDLRRDLPLFGERDFRLVAVDGDARRRPRPADPGAAQPGPQRGRAHRSGRPGGGRGARADGGRLEISVADSGPRDPGR